MKTSIIPVCLLLACTCILYSCSQPDPLYPDTPNCKIVKIISNGGANKDSIVIAYNSLGNPISILRTAAITGSPNYFFRYDQQNRLIDKIGAYGDESGDNYYETWHHYIYKGNSKRPFADSSYAFGTIGTGPLPGPDYLSKGYTTFSYDSYGRMVNVLQTEIYPYTDVYTYSYHYNAAGNLDVIVSDFPFGEPEVKYITTYDNKINLHRTHPIWQLIDRDYSVNNPFIAGSYSNDGLPLSFGLPSTSYQLLNSVSGQLEVSYDCEP